MPLFYWRVGLAVVPRRVSRQLKGSGSSEHAHHVGDTADIPLGQIALKGRGVSEHVAHVGDTGDIPQRQLSKAEVLVNM